MKAPASLFPFARNGLPPSSELGRYGAVPLVHGLLVEAVALHVVDRRVRPVDRDLGEVGPAEPRQLGVEVGEEPPGQQRIVGDVDPADEMAGVEGHLLGLGEEVGRVGVEGQGADDLHRRQFLGHDLGRVQQVDALEGLIVGVGEDLDPQVPLGERAGLDRVGEVAAVEVRVGTGDQLRLPPHQGVDPGGRLPVELDQAGLAVGVDQAEGVDPEPLHHPPRPRDAPVRHRPHDVVGWPRCATRRSPRRCRGPSGPGGSHGRGAAWRRG
jgi:hypothetical protein